MATSTADDLARAERLDAEDSERRVTELELFFDLVFVFALTQITAALAGDPSWEGVARGMAWWMVAPCLALCFLFGPAGFLLFLALRRLRGA